VRVFSVSLLASIAGAIVGGLLITATGRYKWLALLDAVLMIAGILLLLRLDVHSSGLDIVVALLVLGPGVGSGLSLYTLSVQNAMPGRIGQATAAVVFFRQLGQSIGLVAIGTVVTTSYVPAFHRSLPSALGQALSAQLIKAFENPLVLTSPVIMAPIRGASSATEHRASLLSTWCSMPCAPLWRKASTARSCLAWF
jgi:hypothetical protein